MSVLRLTRARIDDDRGSLPFAMLVVLVGMLLGAAVMPMLFSMRTGNNFNVTRVRALAAAQSGVDLVVGKIREAVDSTTGNGDPSQLPCTNSADQATSNPLIGDVANSTASGATPIGQYSVVVKYYTVDPVRNPTATAMICVPGAGPYQSSTGSVVPSYAKIISTGYSPRNNQAGGSAGRTLISIYAFNVDNNNINGGNIRLYPSSSTESTKWCIDVGSATPAPGTVATLQPCTSPLSDQQSFAYGTDLTLKIVSSINEVYGGTTYRQGMCLDVINTTGSGSSAQPVNGSSIVVEPCGNADGSVDWSQQWSFDDYSELRASKASSATTVGSGGSNLSSYCMSAASHTAGVSIKLGTCDQSIISPVDAWLPSPAAGAGQAYSDPDDMNSKYVQIINFQQFGRCINDPGSNPNAGFVIVAGCKQNPNPNSVSANQEYQFYVKSTNTALGTMTGQLTLTISNTRYCLRSPGVTSSTDPQDFLVDIVSCSTGTNSPTLLWTRTTPKSTGSLAVPYSLQYRFIDNVGMCMSVATVTGVSGDTNYSQWSKLVTATCDGTTAQQWNADNSVLNSSLNNTLETPPTTSGG